MIVSLCVFQSDPLLYLLEEFNQQSGGGLQSQEETTSPCTTPLGELGIGEMSGEVVGEADVVGSAAAQLDTINELIQSEHHYFKIQPTTDVGSNVVVSSTNVHDTVNKPQISLLGSESLGAQLSLPTSQQRQVVVISRPPVPASSTSRPLQAIAPNLAPRPIAPKVEPRSLLNTTILSTREALSRMVNPNEVCVPRTALQPDLATTSTDAGLLQDNLLPDLEFDKIFDESENLLSFEHLSEFLQFPAEEQQNLITELGNSEKDLKKDKAQDVNVVSHVNVPTSPTVSVPDMSRVDFDSSFDEDFVSSSGQRSPDSGFSTSSYSTSSSPHYDPLSSPHSDANDISLQDNILDWGEDAFLSVFDS